MILTVWGIRIRVVFSENVTKGKYVDRVFKHNLIYFPSQQLKTLFVLTTMITLGDVLT